MRTAVTVVRRHGSNQFELLHGPEVPIHDQKRALKTLLGNRDNPTFAEVRQYPSLGKHRSFARARELTPFRFRPPPAPAVSPTPSKPKRVRRTRKTKTDW